jgi:hypothetical protein
MNVYEEETAWNPSHPVKDRKFLAPSRLRRSLFYVVLVSILTFSCVYLIFNPDQTYATPSKGIVPHRAAAPVEAIPVKATPVEAIPVKAIPVEAVPVKTAPVKAVQPELFVDFKQEEGNLEPISNHVSPRVPPLPKMSGILAIPVGGKSKAAILPVLNHFYHAGCKIILFHYDDSVWTDVPHYAEYVTVRALGQTKFWFAKRFLVPELLSNYEYLFLWDDDVGMDKMMWDPVQFMQTMRDYHIDVAQPALTQGIFYHAHVTKLQSNPPESKEPLVGRWTNFVEMMFPVYSVKAWTSCVWQTLPNDGVSYCGTDFIWYPTCAGVSRCRFAVLDGFPVAHNNGKVLGPHSQGFGHEMGLYLEKVIQMCQPPKYTMPSLADMSLTMPLSKEHQYDMLCTYISKQGHDKNISIRKMVPEDKANTFCPRLPNWPSIPIPWYPAA